MRNRALVEWLARHVGLTKRWKSGRMLALDAGVSHTTVNTILEGGKVKADTLIALARAVGDNPVAVLVAGGVLKPGEAGERRLGEVESEWLDLLDQMSADDRVLVRRVAEGLLGQYVRQRESLVEEPRRRPAVRA